MSNYYAAVGSDGSDLVVWGAHLTERDALTDADRWLSELPEDQRDTDLDVYRISSRQYEAIRSGTVHWASVTDLAVEETVAALRAAGYDCTWDQPDREKYPGTLVPIVVWTSGSEYHRDTIRAIAGKFRCRIYDYSSQLVRVVFDDEPVNT